MPSSVTCQNLINYARAHAQLKPLLGIAGVQNEPGMSICNDVLQILLSQSFSWKFNRKIGAFFVTQPFVQDIQFAGAVVFALAPPAASATGFQGGGGVGIELTANSGLSESGNTVTCKTLDRHPFIVGQVVYIHNADVAAYNSTFTMDTNALSSTWTGGYTIVTVAADKKSFTFTHTQSNLAISGSAGIKDLGWLEGCATTDISNTGVPQPVGPIEAVDRLSPTNATGDPMKVSVLGQTDDGIITFRTGPTASGTIWQITPVYQMKAKTLVTPADVMSPWPDHLAYVIRQGVLAYAYRLTEKPQQAEIEFQRFNAMIMGARSYMTSEDSNFGIAPSMGIMRG